MSEKLLCAFLHFFTTLLCNIFSLIYIATTPLPHHHHLIQPNNLYVLCLGSIVSPIVLDLYSDEKNRERAYIVLVGDLKYYHRVSSKNPHIAHHWESFCADRSCRQMFPYLLCKAYLSTLLEMKMIRSYTCEHDEFVWVFLSACPHHLIHVPFCKFV